jgi:nucleoside recognition membrane protein YjiH
MRLTNIINYKNNQNTKIAKSSLDSLDKQVLKGFAVIALATLAVTLIPEDAFAATGSNDFEFLTKFLSQITELIKKEGRIALEVLAAGAGAWYGAKSGTWPPVLVGGTSAGMIEMLFKVIT